MTELRVTDAGSVARARRILEEERRALKAAGIEGDLSLTGGSSVEGLVTKGDIDLHLRVAPDAFDGVVAGLRTLLEPVHPEIWTPWLAAFERASEPQTGIAVTVVGSEHDRRFVDAWERMRRDPDAREEYNRLKRRTADYEADKSAFFDRITEQ